MKLLSVPLARIVWSFDVSEINPRGKNIFSDLVPTLIEAYGFKKYPEEGGDFSKGMVFGLGTFTNHNNDEVQVGLTVWSDGIAADTYSNTNDSDEFMEGLIEILPQEGYVFERVMIQRKAYNSHVIVRCEKHLSSLNPRLDEFSKKLSAAINPRLMFEPAGIEFWPNQEAKVANFSFQRKTGADFSDNRYWSQAALRTDKHLELLQDLENILSKEDVSITSEDSPQYGRTRRIQANPALTGRHPVRPSD